MVIKRTLALTAAFAICCHHVMADPIPVQHPENTAEISGQEADQRGPKAALPWWAKDQRADGSWGNEEKHRVVSTSLVLLVLLGHGETNVSARYGHIVTKGLDWLASEALKKKGAFISGDKFGFSHAIATYTLSEAYSMTRLAKLKQPVETALELILKHQKPNGAFALSYKKNGKDHLWFTHANVLAIQSAQIHGLKLPGLKTSAERCAKALKKVFAKGKGFSLDGVKKPDPLSNVLGVHASQLLGEASSDECRRGMVAIKDHGLKFDLMAKEDWPLVRQLGQTLVLFNGRSDDKKSWIIWRKTMELPLSRNLRTRTGVPKLLSFSKAGNAMNEKDFQHYSFMLQALHLEVYYQYLPTFAPSKLGARQSTTSIGN